MKQKRSIARMAVSAGLALAMATGMAAPATVAFADDATTGNITISQTNGQETSFLGYQIFTGKVIDGESPTDGKKVSDIAWASPDVEAVVESVAKDYDGTTFTTAQDAADWIKNNTQKTDSTTAVTPGSVAYKLASALQSSEKLKPTSVTAGKAANLSEGYWLFVTNADTLGDGEVATAPIFAVVGGKDVTVEEKDTIPTITKTVSDGKKVDSVGVGDTVSYKLVGTVASNIDSFSTYSYKFTDTLSDGLDYTDKSAKVTVDGNDVTSKATISYKDHALTVDFKDLKKAGVTITKGTKVTVEYKATVNTKAKAGTKDNNLSNRATLTYSNDPHTADQGGTTTTPIPDQTKSYTYKLHLIKKDRDTEKTLSGAEFTLKDKDGKYIKADGTKSPEKATLTTADDGSLDVNGLDEGTYTLEEITAPGGYDKTGTTKITIKPGFGGTDGKGLTTLEVSVSDNDDAIAGVSDGTTGDNKLAADSKTPATDVTSGTVTVTVGDKKEITMPLTGMKGTTALLVYGSAILVISAGAYLKHRKNQSENDAQ